MEALKNKTLFYLRFRNRAIIVPRILHLFTGVQTKGTARSCPFCKTIGKILPIADSCILYSNIPTNPLHSSCDPADVASFSH